MYRIKNITNGKVILGDLNLTLSRGEEVDLDTKYDRAVIDASRDLDKAIKPERQVLAVLHKEVIIQSSSPVLHQGILDEMVKRAIAGLEIESKPRPANELDLARKLDQILAVIDQQQQARSEILPQPKTDKGLLDRDTSIDIQTRLLKRLSQNVQSHVEAKEETKESSDVKKNADDLGDLLDQM